VTQKEKNKKISETRKATKAKRKNQDCRAFDVKVDRSHMSKSLSNFSKMIFLEAKWMRNYVIASDSIFTADDKMMEVEVKVKDKFEKRKLDNLSSQMKQSVLDGTKKDVHNLAKSKKKGNKVGKLKFKSKCDTIELKQFGNTFRVKGNRIKIQGAGQWYRVRGLEQLQGYEIANAKFIKKGDDYYFRITCYKEKVIKAEAVKPPVGLDFGIKHQLNVSDGMHGINIDYVVGFPKRLRKLYQQLSKKQKHSNNWYKQLSKIDNEFYHWTNQKKDTQNKIFNILGSHFGRICYQDDNLRGWQRIWGKRMLSTGIGGITARLKKSPTSVKVGRYFPSTKRCSKCHHVQVVGLDERIFKCSNSKCNFVADRDFNSGTNNLQEGLRLIGVEYADLKPAEIEPLLAALERLNTVPRLRASLVVETGSPAPLGVG
jgi:transposase